MSIVNYEVPYFMGDILLVSMKLINPPPTMCCMWCYIEPDYWLQWSGVERDRDGPKVQDL